MTDAHTRPGPTPGGTLEPDSGSETAGTQPGAEGLTFSFLTLFPELLAPFAAEAIVGKARERGLLDVRLVNMRDFAGNRHHKVDDTPYGGGAGMVIRVDVAERALASLPAADEVILFSPAGQPFTQAVAEELAGRRHLVFLCGRYEGFDARTEGLVTRELSIGDFVMMGGEAAAACVLEAVARLVPGVIGDPESHQADSFSSGLLDYPEYTRPPEWRGRSVPDVLRGGNHGAVAAWRREQALTRTLARRPDLLVSSPLTPADTVTLSALGATPEQLREWSAPPPPRTKRRKQPRTTAPDPSTDS